MTSFQLPIKYNRATKELEKHVREDMELVSDDALYSAIMEKSHPLGKRTLPLWGLNYTTDHKYLKDTQRILASDIKSYNADSESATNVMEKVNSDDDPHEDDGGFHAKYQYIEWAWLQQFNENPMFLQLLSIYNMASPILSLFLPIFFMILPFFIIKFSGHAITIPKYIEVLKMVFQKHQIGQLFTISAATWDKRMYILISVVFYVLQIYSNIRSCINFCSNMKVIHKELFAIRSHIGESIECMDAFEKTCNKRTTYQPFIDNMKIHRSALKRFHNDLVQINDNTLSFQKFKQIGHVMKCFYQLYHREEYENAINYSFDFCGYIDNMKSLHVGITNGKLNKCKFSKKKTKFTDAYFPITENTPVKNTYDLDKHILITGPNAAGKTTLLKTTLFNVIISQQIGYGCYKKASLSTFDYIHCYINIPDTSGRDSLFQAEARRCKEIIDSMETHGDKAKHFCVFDELYSGTNPYEAIGSAASFLRYLNKHSNVSFIITTHFLDLCRRLDSDEKMSNRHMAINSEGDGFKYTYKLSSGMSNVRGGVKVLNDLEYPDEIVIGTREIIDDLNI